MNHTFSKFMSDLVDSGIWAALSPSAKSLYPVLLRFSDETFKPVFPGTEELLRLTGFKTKKSLQEARKELQSSGLLDILPGTGRTNTRYYFRFDYPGSQVDIERYREETILRRRLQQNPPEGYQNNPLGDNQGIPNNIHININQESNQKQEQLLSNIHGLLKMFLEKEPREKQDDYRQQIVQSLMQKYGELEVGEGIKIAIRQGKEGNIRYLEGILKNRDTIKSNPSGEGVRNSLPEEVSAIFPETLQKYLADLKLWYTYSGSHFLQTTNSSVPIELIEALAAEKGVRLKILMAAQRDALSENAG